MRLPCTTWLSPAPCSADAVSSRCPGRVFAGIWVARDAARGGVPRRRRPDSLGRLGVHTSSGPNWAVSRRCCRASHAASCQMSAVGTDSTKATSASRNASSDWKSSSPDAQKCVTQTPFITSQNRG